MCFGCTPALASRRLDVPRLASVRCLVVHRARSQCRVGQTVQGSESSEKCNPPGIASGTGRRLDVPRPVSARRLDVPQVQLLFRALLLIIEW